MEGGVDVTCATDATAPERAIAVPPAPPTSMAGDNNARQPAPAHARPPAHGRLVDEAFAATEKKVAEEIKARCRAITTNAVAKGRWKLAFHLATETDVSVEEAPAILAVAEAEPEPEARPASRMDLVPCLAITAEQFAAGMTPRRERRPSRADPAAPDGRSDDPWMRAE